MTLQEAFEKYRTDEAFKKEIQDAIEQNKLEELLDKYELPKDELKDFVVSKVECSNCKNTGDIILFSMQSVAIGCIVSAIVEETTSQRKKCL